MAIIYSYPSNNNILSTDLIVCTSTDSTNGNRNQTKSLSIGSLTTFVLTSPSNNLNQVLTNGNTSQLNAKIGELYLYDDPDGSYAKISVSDNIFGVYRSGSGIPMLYTENGASLALYNGTATATILNNLTTSRSYILPDKSGTFALTSDIPTLQQVVDTGNTIVMPTTVSRGIDITLANLETVSQNGVIVTIPNQTGTPYPTYFSAPDAYVAKINGQSPGTLTGFTGGFVVDAHGLDNIGFFADLQSDSETSAGCVMKSFDSHVGDLFRGVKRIVGVESTVFQVANNGDVKANTLSVYDSPNGEYSKIAINDSYFTISRSQGAFTPMLSTEDGANLILTNGNGAAAQIVNNLLVSRNYTLPNASGTFALTSDIAVPSLQLVTDFGDTTSNDITANSFIKSSGTSAQFLKADGSTSTMPTLQQVTEAGSTTTALVIAVTSGKVLIGTNLSGTPTFGTDPHLVVTKPYTGTSIGGVIDLRNLAPSIVANDLLGKIQFTGKDDGGGSGIGYTSSAIECIAAGDSGEGSNSGGILKFMTAANSLGASPIEKMRITQNGAVQPGTDNAYSLGASGIRWSSVWAVTGEIQTSDEREKKDIIDSDLGLDFVSKLRPVSFKWKVGKNEVTSELDGLDEEGNPKTKIVVTPIEGKRTHYGLIAQEVETLLDGKDFGGFIHDAETDIKGLRYDQFIPVLINAIKELKAEIEILKAK